MDEWLLRALIAIVASLIGAVVGAIIRPILEDKLSRKAASDRDQAEMVDAWLEMARKKWAFSLAAAQMVRNGKTVREAATDSVGALYKWMREEPNVTRFPWEPDRVRHQGLRALFNDLSEVMNGLLLYSIEASKGGVDASSFDERIMADVKKAEELRKEIVRTMPAAGL